MQERNFAHRPLAAHRWEKALYGWYVDEQWCSVRLFDVEKFEGDIHDPCCGMGRIPDAARRAGYSTCATDIVDRGYWDFKGCADFLKCDRALARNVVCNPPFDCCDAFVMHALDLTAPAGKVAMIWLTRRLNAARWLAETPLARIHLLTPRPSMPPGQFILAGEKPQGGTQDFAWLVFDHKHEGPPALCWLHRDAQHAQLSFGNFPASGGPPTIQYARGTSTTMTENALPDAKASSRKPIAIYEITEVTVSKRESQFKVRIATETGAFAFPHNFRTLSAAQRACTDHFDQWWRKITQVSE